jgi:hypothetical protein
MAMSWCLGLEGIVLRRQLVEKVLLLHLEIGGV